MHITEEWGYPLFAQTLLTFQLAQTVIHRAPQTKSPQLITSFVLMFPALTAGTLTEMELARFLLLVAMDEERAIPPIQIAGERILSTWRRLAVSTTALHFYGILNAHTILITSAAAFANTAAAVAPHPCLVRHLLAQT